MTEEEKLKRAAACALAHVAALLSQDTARQIADFMDPCCDCPYAEHIKCDYGWVDAMEPLMDLSGVDPVITNAQPDGTLGIWHRMALLEGYTAPL